MTTISNYTDLQSAVVEYLARDQDTTLIARVPTFIQFAEAKLNRLLFVRQMEIRSTTILDAGAAEPEFVTLPPDFQSMRRIRLSSVSGKPLLTFMTNIQIDEYRTTKGDANGQPLFFAISGNEIELAPTPDASYTVEMIYRQNIPSLAANGTNWLLALAPDLYLYGALLEASPYIKNDNRIAVWNAGFSSALSDLNGLGNTSTFNAGPIQVRPTGATP